MSHGTKALPAGWVKVLDDVQARLDHAVSLANARIDALPDAQTAHAGAERVHEIEQWSVRLNRLSAYLESAEQVVRNVDEMLQEEAARLKETQAAGETLRQKLAACTARA